MCRGIKGLGDPKYGDPSATPQDDGVEGVGKRKGVGGKKYGDPSAAPQDDGVEGGGDGGGRRGGIRRSFGYASG